LFIVPYQKQSDQI